MDIQITDFDEVLAVWENQIEGFVYDDGEVYADTDSLERWRAIHDSVREAVYNAPFPSTLLVTCRGCGVLSRVELCPNCQHTDATYNIQSA